MSKLFRNFAVALLVGAGAAVTLHLSGDPSSQNAIAATAPQGSFDQMMADAMDRMGKGIAIAHSGNPDRDFAAMMIPHHQGAIDMARIQLQFGRDPILRRLAQAIIVEQQQEIEVMRRELSRLPPSRSERLASPPAPIHSHSVIKEQ
ncbi:MAG TPA: DUF305 domain-containing protein [Casimicrobiaceae bacterium]|nr:DUF305 domain-containing protein [Casimicrobiaceae bacterium]